LLRNREWVQITKDEIVSFLGHLLSQLNTVKQAIHAAAHIDAVKSNFDDFEQSFRPNTEEE